MGEETEENVVAIECVREILSGGRRRSLLKIECALLVIAVLFSIMGHAAVNACVLGCGRGHAS